MVLLLEAVVAVLVMVVPLLRCRQFDGVVVAVGVRVKCSGNGVDEGGAGVVKDVSWAGVESWVGVECWAGVWGWAWVVGWAGVESRLGVVC